MKIQKFAAIIAVVLFSSFWMNSAIAQSNSESIILLNARLIDGNGDTPKENVSILIQDGIIKTISYTPISSKTTRVIDVAGKTVMPGLADMHIHITSSWDGDGFNLLGYKEQLNAMLYAGVTTVLDTGGNLPFSAQIHQEIESGRLSGPQFLYLGPLVDGPDPNWPDISYSLASQTQASRIVNHLHKSGVHGVKAYGGLSSPEVRSLIHAAREVDLPVFVDLWVRTGAEHIITSGLRGLAHPPRRVTPEILTTMKQRDVYVMTTLSGYESILRFKERGLLDNPLIDSTIAPERLSRMRAVAGEDLTDGEKEEHGWRREFLDQMMDHTRQVHEAGIPVVAGTDGPTKGVFLGEGLHRELELLVEAGLTPLEAISAATRNGAMMMKTEDEWGTIEAGKRADLLVIDGRPDQTISDTRNIVTVIQAGRLIDRNDLKSRVIDSKDVHDFVPTEN